VAIKIENKRQQLRCQQNKSAAAISLFDSKRDKLFRPALGTGADGRPFFYSVAEKVEIVICAIFTDEYTCTYNAYTISSFLFSYFIN